MQQHIRREVIVPAQRDAVWHAWTTVEGAKTFFAPDARLDLSIGGAYEILFNLSEPPGQQGSEGCTVLSYLPGVMLSFSWNNPPILPDIRHDQTWVVLQLEDVPDGVRTVLTHLGWREGESWQRALAYFEDAWSLVLARLKHRFEVGPLDWSAPWRPDGG